MKLLKQIKTSARALVESSQWPKRPSILNFEITAACDSKCIHCPRHNMDRKMLPMDFELFKKIIDEAADMKIPEIKPNGYGEILVLPKLDQYLGHISSKSHPFKITLNTNGYRMTDEKIDLFIRHRVNLLNICIDGATKETAEKVRVGLEMNVIEDNVHRLLKERKRRGSKFPRVRIGMIVIPENEHEVEAFKKKWEGVADFIGTDSYSNRAGSLDEKYGASERIQSRCCVYPFQELTLLANGDVTICCNDWNAENVIGNAKDQTLQEIWHGEGYRRTRELHIKGDGAQIEVCRKCNYWPSPAPGTKLWI